MLSDPCFLFLAPAYSQNIYASENPVEVGSTVTLTSQTSVTTGVWMFKSDIIVIIYPGNAIIDNTWRNRVTVNSTTSSLTIRSLQVEDSGLYTLEEVNSFRAQLTLSVQGKDRLITFHAYSLPKCILNHSRSINTHMHVDTHSKSPVLY